MAETKYLHGVWSPWATVTCTDCHNKSSEPRRKLQTAHLVSASEMDEDEQITRCDECGREIVLSDSVAIPHYIALNAGLSMEQTGGMCCAAMRALPGGRLLVVTSMDHINQAEVGIYATPQEFGEAMPSILNEYGIHPTDALKLIHEHDPQGPLQALTMRIDGEPVEVADCPGGFQITRKADAGLTVYAANSVDEGFFVAIIPTSTYEEHGLPYCYHEDPEIKHASGQFEVDQVLEWLTDNGVEFEGVAPRDYWTGTALDMGGIGDIPEEAWG